ncbi:hypothetical protein HanHA300_Chr15g0581931 [Helianthus annuus]|nr:hypothetical protein HanHA300_Chr15g0581931 [Helianthus annuus]KAJ0457672.1 hypothetical protein HanIR_Chr15g0776381 [Helianthus annuus]KAJ0474610.1 hypothetical protein HanHA89_Chr15g0631661 [Helianthus annuus]KAJ0650167.1 hypothetical protein HanLR1_Chr15g0592581 [Helianthus annuus]KAJ0653939.1 hypothetical protein HanOQP8_Chr15g0589231 [Helianthus annuus]
MLTLYLKTTHPPLKSPSRAYPLTIAHLKQACGVLILPTETHIVFFIAAVAAVPHQQSAPLDYSDYYHRRHVPVDLSCKSVKVEGLKMHTNCSMKCSNQNNFYFTCFTSLLETLDTVRCNLAIFWN